MPRRKESNHIIFERTYGTNLVDETELQSNDELNLEATKLKPSTVGDKVAGVQTIRTPSEFSESAEKAVPRRKLVVPPRERPLHTDMGTSVIPTLDTLIHDAISIISSELGRYKSKTARGITLELKEARAVQGYMDSLVKMSKEQRDAAKSEDLSNLTDDELLRLAVEHAQRKKLPAPTSNDDDDTNNQDNE